MIIILITELAIEPDIPTVIALKNITLTCYDPELVSNSTTEDFLWHRVSGKIPAKCSGQESRRLTIPNVVPEDEGQYYCTARRHGIHCSKSKSVHLKVDGEKTVPCNCIVISCLL